MFRDENVDAEKFVSKFKMLKQSFDEKDEVQLDSEYHKQIKAYIERLYLQTCMGEPMTDKELDNMREPEMSNLNRLQKQKNRGSYKKDKHKAQRHNEDWG